MDLSDLTVEVRDVNLVRQGQIEDRYLDAKLEPVFDYPGKWAIRLPNEHPMAPVLALPGSGIIVTHTDPAVGVLLSGPSLSPARTADRTDPDGTSVFTGTTDDVLLWRRVAYPTPSTADVTAQVAAYDVRSGIAETVMRAYVNANMGPGAPAARRVAALTLAADLARGISVNYSARFDRLGDMLASIATVAGLGFRVVQIGAGLQFQVYDPSDKSSLIRLDMANGTLVSQSVTRSAPTLTRAIVAGQGVGEDRTLIEVATATTDETDWGMFGRIEGFIDQRNTNDPVELTQSGTEAILDGASGLAVQAVPGDDTTMSYPTDWGLGDVLGLVVDNTQASAQVTGATILINPTVGVTIGASIGDVQGWDPQAGIRKTVAAQDERLSNLERNLESATSTVADANSSMDSYVREGRFDIDTAALADTITNLPVPPIPGVGKPGVGGVRHGVQGTLTVHPTPTRVRQVFESIVGASMGPITLTWKRLRGSTGIWGPWILQNDKIVVYSNLEQEQACKVWTVPTPDSPVTTWRDEFRPPVVRAGTDPNTIFDPITRAYVGTYGWLSFTYANANWADYGSGYTPVQVSRTAEGLVILRGLARYVPAGNPGGLVIGTLPVGFRPAAKTTFGTMDPGNASGGNFSIDAAGVVTWLGNTSGTGSYVALEAMFPAAEAAPDAAWTQITTFLGTWSDYKAVDATQPNLAYWVDTLGRVWFRGMIRSTAAGPLAADSPAFTLPGVFATNQQIHFNGPGNVGMSAWHTVLSGGLAQFVVKTASGTAWAGLGNYIQLPVAAFPEARFGPINMGTGWSDYAPATYPGGSYILHTDGIFQLRGLIKSNGTAGVMSLVSPTYRIGGAAKQIFTTLGAYPANNVARFDAVNDGTFNPIPSPGPTAWRSLNNIQYLVEG